jgi:HlyD family secretion protein
MEITAPVSGTVLSVGVERGSIVASAISNVSGGTALATVADLSDLRVIGAIDEAQIGRVQVDQQVEIRVDAYTERTFVGRVARVSPLGVETSNVVTFDVEIVVEDENASLLRSGMSADLTIITGQQEGILVPLTAVRSEGGRRFVVLASGETRQIRTGSTDGRQLVVLEGLNDGELVSTAAAPSSATPTPRSGLLPGGRGGPGGPPR